jgi:tRNA A-37 threonylcarbamoyl transferase component Bud32/tetratricopeptide (TPR) repeat protein
MAETAGWEAPLRAGAEIGHYRIVECIGHGGMGVVYAAEDGRLGRRVALKLLSADARNNKSRLDRFTHEARTVSSLNHPGIVTIFDIGESAYGPFIAMELVDGRTLRHAARDTTLAELIRYVEEIARALAAAHAADIVHRDLKPENVMVRGDGYVKILDFGLARLVDTAGTSATVTGTEIGVVMGTLKYMSPEQVQGQEPRQASDVFSLGVLFYELATHQHPFAADSQLGAIGAIVSANPVPPARLNPEIPAEIDALIMAMLEKESARRPSSLEVASRLGTPSGTAAVAPARSAARERPFVGRAAESNALRSALDRVRGGSLLMVVASGDAGTGKSALIERFLADAAASAPPCRIGRSGCQEWLAGPGALLPVLDAIDSLVHGPGGPDVVRLMRLVAPSWALLLSSVTAGATAEADVGKVSLERMKRELAALFQEIGRQTPLVLFIDDLHWADASTTDIIGYLMTRHDVPMLVLGTVRPGELALTRHPFGTLMRDLQARGQCQELPLDRLDADDVARYLSTVCPGHEFPRSFEAMIHRRTEGHPLFLVDLVAYFRDRGAIVLENGRWRLEPGLIDQEQSLPQSVASMVERKIGRLSEDDRKLLVAASVQGVEFDVSVVASATAIPAADVEERLDELQRAHAIILLEGEHELPNHELTARYRFGHALYHAALFGSLRPARRAALSGAVAQALVAAYGEQAATKIPSELAELFRGARDFERAADFYLAAARAASRLFAHREAAELARRGLEACKSLPQGPARYGRELGLLLARGVALVATQTFGSPEVVASYERARDLSTMLGAADVEFGVRFGLVWGYLCQGFGAKALEQASACMAMAEASAQPALLVEANFVLGIVLQARGDTAGALTCFQKAIELYDPAQHAALAYHFGSDPGVHAGFEAGRTLMRMGRMREAREALARADALSLAVGHSTSRCLLLVGRADAAVNDGRVDEAERILDECMTLAAQHGESIAVWGPLYRGLFALLRGDGTGGAALVSQSIALCRSVGMRSTCPAMMGVLSMAQMVAGDPATALKTIDDALREGEEIDERWAFPNLLRDRGAALLMLGNRADAIAALREAIEVARMHGSRLFELEAAIVLAEALGGQHGQDVLAGPLADVQAGGPCHAVERARALSQRLAGTVA